MWISSIFKLIIYKKTKFVRKKLSINAIKFSKINERKNIIRFKKFRILVNICFMCRKHSIRYFVKT